MDIRTWSRVTLRILSVLALLGVIPATARTFNFELDRPTAKHVFLAGEMTDWELSKKPMLKSADGKWRVTVNLPPGQWVYKFVVDGVWISDPSTSDNDSDGRGARHSFVFSGDGPWRERDGIAHGSVETTMVPSGAWGKPMKVNVYLPPGFTRSKAYPVLVLLHGAGMDADQWYKTGQIQRYMDNLIADQLIDPFVVMMPSSADIYYIGKSDAHITQELPLWLASRYGQRLDARHSAIAGMSMGGFGAVILPLNHPNMFGLGYSLSAYFPPDQLATMVIPKPLPFQLRMFTGDRDGVTVSAPPFLDRLVKSGARFSYTQDAGAHTWNYFSLHTANILREVSSYVAAPRP